MHYATSLAHKAMMALQVSGLVCVCIRVACAFAVGGSYLSCLHSGASAPAPPAKCWRKHAQLWTCRRPPSIDLHPSGAHKHKYTHHKTTQIHSNHTQLETDTPEIVNECIRAVRKGGRVSIIGAYAGFCNAFQVCVWCV